MAYYDEIPSHVKLMPKELRLRWYSAKVSREEPAFKFLDELDSGLLPKEIKEELKVLKEKIEGIEIEIIINENGEFNNLQRRLESLVFQIQRSKAKRSKLLMKEFNEQLKEADYRELVVLKKNEEHLSENVNKVKIKLIELCSIVKINPKSYVKLVGLVEELESVK